MSNKRDDAFERSPQYRHMINVENRERKKENRYAQRNQGGGRKIGKKHPDGTYTEISTPDCDWHERWQNPDIEAIREHARRSGNDKIDYGKKQRRGTPA
tara:strand:- start:76 stop:372 length:297 start_codon:yes stop_codon:yes gene_type:complete